MKVSARCSCLKRIVCISPRRSPHGRCSGVKYGWKMSFEEFTLTIPIQIVATVIAGTVQLGVQSWWVSPWSIEGNFLMAYEILGCSPTFRETVVLFLLPSAQRGGLSRDLCDQNQKNKSVWSPLRAVPFADHFPFSFTCASTQVFGTASIIVSVFRHTLALSVLTLCSGAWLAQVCNLQRGNFISEP